MPNMENPNMTPKWLAKSSTYATAVGGASFSPSASVGDMLTNARIDAIDATTASDQQRAAFIERTLRAASATVTSWTGEEVRASTYVTKGSLVVSGGDILARASSPEHAVDFTTGRLLTEASKATYLKAAERATIERRVIDYRLASHLPHRADTLAAEYAGAHLAASIATVRGREKVLAEWPGWAGYFKASEAGASVPEALHSFVNDGKAAAIVRASALLSAQALSLWPEGASAPQEIEMMAAAGREHLSTLWKHGEMLTRADAAVAAMLAAQPEGAEQPQGGAGEGDGAGEPQQVPASEAAEMLGDTHKPGAHLTSTLTQPAAPEIGAAHVKAEGDEADGRYPVHEHKARIDRYSLRSLEEGARPLIAALSRIVWESTTPPVFERGQQRGDIDEGALDRLAAFGDDRVFEVRAEKAPTTVGVQVLVDCSGSMGCHTREGTSRIEAAKRVAFALAKAFGNGGRFKVEVAGHSVGYGYGRVGRVSYDTCATPESITGLHAGGDNADGYAIAHAVDRAARMRADRRIVLLVADGEPNAHGYRGEKAARHIRGVVSSAEARGIEFLAVGIEGEMANTGAACFGPRRFISIPDTRSAGPLLARAITRLAKGGAA